MHPAANTRGVNKSPRFPGEFDEFVYRVSGGSGKLVHDDTFFASSLVEQTRLPHVGATQKGHASWPANFNFRHRRFLGQNRDDLIQKVCHTAAVEG